MARSSQTLTCPQCSYVNEAERVYCHNCGAKLDRTLLPQDDDRKTRETIERTRKRVKKLTNPTSVRQNVRSAANTLVWAAVVALLIQIARPPEGIPAKRTELADRLIGNELIEATESVQPRTLMFTEADANAHLATALRKGEGGLPGVKFERAYTKFEPGVVRIGMEQTIWGYPIYSGVAYRLAVEGGRLIETNLGGHFGRVRVHPALMAYVGVNFKKLWQALGREREHMEKKMRAVQVEKGRIILVTKGAGAA
jgi:hypothetical protein